jgi:anthraniloyl-CoA monooxygenase
MRVLCVGGGPAGLYLGILLKRLDPDIEVEVRERNRPDDTFGWGVVFSDETLTNFERADPRSHRRIVERFAYWKDIDIFVRGAHVRSQGHGFAGISRRAFLQVLQERAAELGVTLQYGTEVTGLEGLDGFDLVVGADGVNSRVRELLALQLEPSLDWRRCKFVWLGTDLRYEAFTFHFKPSVHGLFQVHAYPFDEHTSTFIVECREETWRRAGLDEADEARTLAYLERLFADELRGHRLLANRSIWRTFPTVRNRRWHHGRVVLLGDAAHTAHFSIGSGTKLAMEDSIALAEAFARLGRGDVPAVLSAYEAARRPEVERLQSAAQVSLEWFENSERYLAQPPLQFAFNLMTRSKRITWDNLALRDPELVARVGAWFEGANPAREARVDPPAYAAGSDPVGERTAPLPPAFQPYRVRDLTLSNRIVVSPMCQYSCQDGLVNDWHLVHLGSRAIGGAGLVIAEATAVSAQGRISPGCAGMYRPEHEGAWRRIVDFVHAHSATRIGLQIGHAGRKASTEVPWRGGGPLQHGAWPTVAPSALAYDAAWPVPSALDRAGLEAVRDDFVRATRMALRAGFDWLELHMAHGYLLAGFLSPLTNHRDDAHGGSLEGRLRFPLEVLSAVRAEWPAGRPLSVRISATDWKQGGLTSEDRLGIARALQERGCDVIDVSAGGTVPDQQPIYGRMFQVPFSDEIRNQAGVPTMTVGNIVDVDQANTILAAGRADLVVMARAHLVDPYLTLHAAERYAVEGAYWPPQYLRARPARRKG